jgi:hypothetical protein
MSANAQLFFSGNPQMRTSNGISIHRKLNNIKTDIKETEHQETEWIQLVKDRLKWKASVGKILTIQFHKNQAI